MALQVSQDQQYPGVSNRKDDIAEAHARGIDHDDLPPTFVKFWEFHTKHPQVYRALVLRARELQAAGWTSIGIPVVWERVRYDRMVEVGPDEPYRLNNDFRSSYARMLNEEPGLEGFIRTRRASSLDENDD